MFLECVDRLVHESHTVGKEEHSFYPIAPHEQVAQRDHRSGLARSGSHHHEGLAVVVALERLGNAADRARLVIPLDDGRVDLGLPEWLAVAPAQDR
ncbi:MAG: hypothetical protein M0000_05350 [Actinomycetota bacterium]|nr:hypothetical protein [Actinomycetota bacterium]